MASLKLDTRRICWCQNKKVMFHCWSNVTNIVPPSPLAGGDLGGVLTNTYGIVEFESGEVKQVRPEEIIFADGGDFKEYLFRYDLEADDNQPTNNKPYIFYLCDKKKCKNCNYPACKHTQDITHAKNFKKDDEYEAMDIDSYFEIENIQPPACTASTIHAKWKNGGNGLYDTCTNCDEEIYLAFDMNYCPKCGAKLEAEDAE